MAYPLQAKEKECWEKGTHKARYGRSSTCCASLMDDCGSVPLELGTVEAGGTPVVSMLKRGGMVLSQLEELNRSIFTPRISTN